MDFIELYTWQSPEWDIVNEKRDPSKGHSVWGDIYDDLRFLYEKLGKIVGTQDFIWCDPEYKHWCQLEIRKLWVLKVPIAEVFHFLDDSLWSKLLQNKAENKLLKD